MPPIWMRCHGRRQSGGQNGDRVADPDRAGFDAAHEATVVVQVRVGRVLRAADVLHREAELLGVFAVRARGGFEDFQQRRALVPVQRVATIDDHVAVERRHRDEAHVVDAELGGEVEVVGPDLLEGLLRILDQVHLVDRDDEMRDADQCAS